MKTVLLKNIENEYLQEIKSKLTDNENLTTDTLIEFSISQYQNVKVKGIPIEIQDYDMLLFQYGVYDYPKLGRHFNFDITRQFSKKIQMHLLSAFVYIDF